MHVCRLSLPAYGCVLPHAQRLEGKVRSMEERPLALDPVRSPKGVNREQHTHRSDSVPTGAEVMFVVLLLACRARQPLHVICFFLGPPRFYGPYFFLSRRRKAR